MGVGNTGGTPETLDLTHGGTTEQEGLGTSGVLHSELIEFSAGATSGNNASAGSLGETESNNVQLGEGELTLIISDATNNDGGTFDLLTQVLNELGEGHWGAVSAGGDKATQNSLAEAGIGTAGEEAEKLKESIKVMI